MGSERSRLREQYPRDVTLGRAVRDGFEPPMSSFLIRLLDAPETGECVCQFRHPTLVYKNLLLSRHLGLPIHTTGTLPHA